MLSNANARKYSRVIGVIVLAACNTYSLFIVAHNTYRTFCIFFFSFLCRRYYFLYAYTVCECSSAQCCCYFVVVVGFFFYNVNSYSSTLRTLSLYCMVIESLSVRCIAHYVCCESALQFCLLLLLNRKQTFWYPNIRHICTRRFFTKKTT